MTTEQHIDEFKKALNPGIKITGTNRLRSTVRFYGTHRVETNPYRKEAFMVEISMQDLHDRNTEKFKAYEPKS